jgi:hypothetical protein
MSVMKGGILQCFVFIHIYRMTFDNFAFCNTQFDNNVYGSIYSPQLRNSSDRTDNSEIELARYPPVFKLLCRLAFLRDCVEPIGIFMGPGRASIDSLS